MTAQKKTQNRKRTVNGDLTIYTATDWTTDLLQRLNDCDSLTVDLSKVAEMDSAGLQLLLLLKREAGQQDCKLVLAHPSETVLEVLDLLNMREPFGIDAEQAPASE
jgi:anti-anti-sigma factor